MATVPITYWWSHADGTLHRWMRDDVVVPPPPPPPPPPTTGYRFPGDTLPLKSGQLLWGIDQADGDPSERELAAGKKPVGAMRRYFKTSASLPWPNGQAAQQIRLHQSKGRVPWVSILYTDWANQAAGASNSAWYAFIAGCEEDLHAPVLATLNHEPKDNCYAKGGTFGSETDWGNMQKAFRAQMDAYATAKAGSPGAYTWKNLSFAPILTADTYATGSGAGGVDLFMAGVPSRTFDFMGVDMYEQVPKPGQPYGPLWSSNWVKSLTWCKAHGKAVGLAEWGIPQADPLAAAKLRDFYTRLLDGTNDVFLACYFDSDAGTGSTTWLLTDTGNGGCLTAWLDELKDDRSIHFYDTGYPRPAGV